MKQYRSKEIVKGTQFTDAMALASILVKELDTSVEFAQFADKPGLLRIRWNREWLDVHQGDWVVIRTILVLDPDSKNSKYLAGYTNKHFHQLFENCEETVKQCNCQGNCEIVF